MTDSTALEYLKMVLEKEFLKTYMRYTYLGVLHYEVTNILELCRPLVRGLSEDDHFLRNEVIGTITNYLQDV